MTCNQPYIYIYSIQPVTYNLQPPHRWLAWRGGGATGQLLGEPSAQSTRRHMLLLARVAWRWGRRTCTSTRFGEKMWPNHIEYKQDVIQRYGSRVLVSSSDNLQVAVAKITRFVRSRGCTVMYAIGFIAEMSNATLNLDNAMNGDSCQLLVDAEQAATDADLLETITPAVLRRIAERKDVLRTLRCIEPGHVYNQVANIVYLTAVTQAVVALQSVQRVSCIVYTVYCVVSIV